MCGWSEGYCLIEEAMIITTKYYLISLEFINYFLLVLNRNILFESCIKNCLFIIVLRPFITLNLSLKKIFLLIITRNENIFQSYTAP